MEIVYKLAAIVLDALENYSRLPAAQRARVDAEFRRMIDDTLAMPKSTPEQQAERIAALLNRFNTLILQLL